eukprot:700399-Pleurochrysis_carterae.AAC.3
MANPPVLKYRTFWSAESIESISGQSAIIYYGQCCLMLPDAGSRTQICVGTAQCGADGDTYEIT